MRVPESSQRKGSEKVSAAQEAKVIVHASFQGTIGLAFVYDGKYISELVCARLDHKFRCIHGILTAKTLRDRNEAHLDDRPFWPYYGTPESSGGLESSTQAL